MPKSASSPDPTCPFIGRYHAKEKPLHPGDYLLVLSSSLSETHTFDTAHYPRGTSLREAAQEWCTAQRRTLKIDWSTLTNDL